MQFVSYAQNFEDVMLWRALKSIKEGFYFDVGAWSPDEDSVTRLFSENGWRGINIEPNPEYFSQLIGRRPRDINLAVAVGDRCATVEMHMVPGSGLSTCDTSVASALASRGWKTDVVSVELTTLSAIWHNHIPRGQDVHFLKVDVEGYEQAVIFGNDWTENRPWIVVVEAISPLTHAERYLEWEGALLSAGYIFCYGDGLNRYYVCEEHSDLIELFKYPPNVFDSFWTVREARLATEVNALRRALSDAGVEPESPEQLLDPVSERMVDLSERILALEKEIHALRTSTSWRVTDPLRRLADMQWLKAPVRLRNAAKAARRAIAPWHKSCSGLRNTVSGMASSGRTE
jgi:FkbM family methyltransferase